MSEGTRKHPIRINDELWDAASAKAKKEKTTVSAKVRGFLTEWVNSDKPADQDAQTDNQTDPKDGQQP